MSTSVTIRRHRPYREARWELTVGTLVAALLVAAPAHAQAQGVATPASAAAVSATGAPAVAPTATTPAPAKPGTAARKGMTREEMIRLNPKIHPSAFARSYDELGVPAAIEKARRGDGEDLFTIIAQINGNPRLLPPKQQLPAFHAYLTDRNYLVQWLGVEVVTGMKDKSSLKPLQDYIMAAQKQKLDPKALPKYELIAAAKAQQSALYALGEIGADDSATTKMLAAMLSKDVPMEWGGGYAHAAMAKKGREGLMVLLKEAEAMALTKKSAAENDRQQRFITSAIGSINDPALLPDIYAGCLKTSYPTQVRESMVMVITRMGKTSPAAEKMLIDMANDPALDIRCTAIDQLGTLGSENAIKALNALRATTTDDKISAIIDGALMKCDVGQILYIQVNRLLDEKTDYDERLRILQNIMRVDNKVLKNHVDLLATCLKLKYKEKPMNYEIKQIWERIYGMTGMIYDIEIDCDDDLQRDHYIAISGIKSRIVSKIWTKNRENNIFNMTTEQVEKKAEDEIRPHVKIFIEKQAGVGK